MTGRNSRSRTAPVDPAALTPEDRATIAAIVEDIRDGEGFGGQCGFVCEVLAQDYGWVSYGGVYHSADGRPIGDHVWSVHEPTGTIIDATADQFGEGVDLPVLAPGDPLAARYRCADSDEQEEAWLDSARKAVVTHGDYWWVPGGLSNPNVVAYEANVARWERR